MLVYLVPLPFVRPVGIDDSLPAASSSVSLSSRAAAPRAPGLSMGSPSSVGRASRTAESIWPASSPRPDASSETALSADKAESGSFVEAESSRTSSEWARPVGLSLQRIWVELGTGEDSWFGSGLGRKRLWVINQIVGSPESGSLIPLAHRNASQQLSLDALHVLQQKPALIEAACELYCW